jgi:hypothetical protein
MRREFIGHLDTTMSQALHAHKPPLMAANSPAPRLLLARSGRTLNFRNRVVSRPLQSRYQTSAPAHAVKR